MKRIFLSLFIVFILLLGLFALRYGGTLFQEGNPLPILSSILDLEMSGSEYEKFAESETQSRYISANIGDSPYDVLMEFMDDQGWAFEEQLGSGFVFEKDEESLVIETRQYSTHYFLWDVPSAVLD